MCSLKDTQAAIRESLRALSGFFVDDGTLGDTLLRVSQMACEATSAKYAAITMLVDGVPSTGVFTNDEAPEIDQAQYDTGNGPCLDAFRNQHTNRIDSTLNDDRWPEFAQVAASPSVSTFSETVCLNKSMS
jgi:hypothetical protein